MEIIYLDWKSTPYSITLLSIVRVSASDTTSLWYLQRGALSVQIKSSNKIMFPLWRLCVPLSPLNSATLSIDASFICRETIQKLHFCLWMKVQGDRVKKQWRETYQKSNTLIKYIFKNAYLPKWQQIIRALVLRLDFSTHSSVTCFLLAAHVTEWVKINPAAFRIHFRQHLSSSFNCSQPSTPSSDADDA